MASTFGVGATKRIAEHASSLKYSDLPPALVALTKQCILDTLGVMIGATGLAPEAKAIANYTKRQEARPESTLFGFGGKTTAALAAFANGSFGHMLDYDDVCVFASHISIATVPVALALAERSRNINGEELITSIVAGTDVMARLELSIPILDWRITEGWFATQLLGYIAGAVTAGRILKLSSTQMEEALGIAFTQLSGSYQMALGTSTHLRSMQAGFSGHGGVLSADLALEGISGSREILEGKYGFFSTYVRTPAPRWNALLDSLGTYFPVLDNHHFKQWPACDHTRPVNIAIAKLLKLSLDPNAIASVSIIGGSGGTRLLCEPIESKRRPKSSIDGKFSIPFTAGALLANGTIRLADYTDAGRSNPEILAIADKIRYVPSSSSNDSDGIPRVEIRLKSGEKLESKATTEDLKRPVDDNFLVEKFMDCTSFSASPVDPERARGAVLLVKRIEELSDVRQLINQLYPI